ncbi:MAG: oligopeptidase A, partial [Candidatus Acinetobacter avistercoris]|nr:oligopeptidase A [Candidatus Acinetobacter avistercoris]
MTLEKATLPVPQFYQITLEQLKADIQQVIENGQTFIAELQQVPESVQEQLQILEKIDTLENQMSESWGVLSHLNAVMNNAETREVYQALLPSLSEYYTQLGQH